VIENLVDDPLIFDPGAEIQRLEDDVRCAIAAGRFELAGSVETAVLESWVGGVNSGLIRHMRPETLSGFRLKPAAVSRCWRNARP
jgi:hypothetical protein